MKNPESTSFGEKHVSPEEKTELVHGVFENVARKYDIMNDAMSGGIHRLWKNRFIAQIRPRPGMDYLDVAGGTGDIAFRINEKLKGGAGSITLCDLTYNMLEVGRDRSIDRGAGDKFEWVTGNAEKLPFPDNSFDIYTIAFGLRNVTHIDDALSEAFRVLRPGGKFFCLEFSRVENPALSRLYDLYSDHLIPRMGQAIAGDRESYKYLVESIRKFPTQRKLEARLRDAGFTRTRYTNLSAGIACIHQGLKP